MVVVEIVNTAAIRIAYMWRRTAAILWLSAKASVVTISGSGHVRQHAREYAATCKRVSRRTPTAAQEHRGEKPILALAEPVAPHPNEPQERDAREGYELRCDVDLSIGQP